MAGHRTRGALLSFGDGTAQTAENVSTATLSTGRLTITLTATHAFEDNDVVLLANIGGFTNLPTYGVVTDASATTISIPTPGASGTYTSGGTVTNQNTAGSSGWTTVASVANFRFGAQRDRLDVSAIDTVLGFREFDSGMASGDFTIGLRWRPTQASQNMAAGVASLYEIGNAVWLRVTFPHIATPAPAMAALSVPLESSVAGSTEDALSMDFNGALNSNLIHRQ